MLVLGQPREKFNADWLPAKIEFNKQSNNDPTYEKRTRPMSRRHARQPGAAVAPGA